jgi:hypothetical protein
VIKAKFTERELPTPARETKDQETLAAMGKLEKKNKPANPDAVGVGENHAIFLKDKGMLPSILGQKGCLCFVNVGDKFYRSNDLLAAISAYTSALETEKAETGANQNPSLVSPIACRCLSNLAACNLQLAMQTLETSADAKNPAVFLTADFVAALTRLRSCIKDCTLALGAASKSSGLGKDEKVWKTA